MNESEAIRRSIPAFQSSVDKHKSQQTGVEFVTWALFFPAAILLDDGEQYSVPLAEAKGQLEAIQLQLQTKDCKSTLTAES